MAFIGAMVCCGCQKLKKQTGGNKIRQVLLIQRYCLMLRKLVSCRLLDTGRKYRFTLCLYSLLVSRQNIGPSGLFDLSWYSRHSCVCTGFQFGVTQVWDFSEHHKREMDWLQIKIYVCIWIFFCGQSHLDPQADPCLSLCNLSVFGSVFPEIRICSSPVIESWKGWKKPRGHLIHSFQLIQD